ncbi:MFS transporter [Streptomyces sp. NPDC058476]
MQQMYPNRERGRVFGYYGATVALSTAIGPLLGGVILQIFGTADGWRYTFYLFVPFAALAFALALRALPQDRRTGVRHSLDLIGALALGLAVSAVMLPLLQTGQNVNRHWWLMGAGAVLLVVFVVRERGLARRGRQPLVDLNLFRVRAYWIGVLVAAALYGGFTGIFLVLAQYLQRGLHYTPLQSALATVAFTAGSVACGIVAGRQVQRFGRLLVIGGTAVTTLGLASAALVIRFSSGAHMGLVLALPLLVAGCGAGCVISANQTLALQRVPRREGSTSAGVYQTGMKIGTSLGVTLATSLFFQEMTATRGDYAAAAALGLTGCAAMAGAAFLVALPGLTLRVRGQSPAAVVAADEVGSLAR